MAFPSLFKKLCVGFFFPWLLHSARRILVPVPEIESGPLAVNESSESQPLDHRGSNPSLSLFKDVKRRGSRD